MLASSIARYEKYRATLGPLRWGNARGSKGEHGLLVVFRMPFGGLSGEAPWSLEKTKEHKSYLVGSDLERKRHININNFVR